MWRGTKIVERQDTVVVPKSGSKPTRIDVAHAGALLDGHHKEPSCKLEATGPVTPPPTRKSVTIVQGVSPHDPSHNVEELSEDGTPEHDSASVLPSTQTRRNLNTEFVSTDCALADEDCHRASDIGATLDEETKEAAADPGTSTLYNSMGRVTPY
ncbi:hypothetical protein PRNP1_005489 [Phytophthora ramorum]